MARNYQRDERDWPRQQQNWPEQNRWPGNRRDEEYGWGTQGQEGRNWRDDDYERRGEQEMGTRWSRGMRGMRGMQDPWGGDEREMWEGGGRPGYERSNWGRERNYGMQGRGAWEGSDLGWDRGRERWQGGRGRGWQGDRWQGAESRGGWESDYGTPYDPSRNLAERYSGLGGRGWYEGWNEAMRAEGQHAGRGPRAYRRSDNRIEEDINDRLTQHPMIDATDIEVSVQNGDVTLRGHADHRQAKRLAEDIAESVFGVKEVTNQIKTRQRGESEIRHETEGPGKQRKAG